MTVDLEPTRPRCGGEREVMGREDEALELLALVSASVAHWQGGDGRLNVLYVIDPLVFLGALGVSYLCFLRLAGPTGRPTLSKGHAAG